VPSALLLGIESVGGGFRARRLALFVTLASVDAVPGGHLGRLDLDLAALGLVGGPAFGDRGFLGFAVGNLGFGGGTLVGLDADTLKAPLATEIATTQQISGHLLDPTGHFPETPAG
jgi:hypothetical protein